jgi:asparagine N-glycosylation enzyme membrane subunit Stt3
MWRLLKLNSPEWKALALGFFFFMSTGAIMPVLAIFYGAMFQVSYIELRKYSSVVAYIHLVLAVKVGMAACCRLEMSRS